MNNKNYSDNIANSNCQVCSPKKNMYTFYTSPDSGSRGHHMKKYLDKFVLVDRCPICSRTNNTCEDKGNNNNNDNSNDTNNNDRRCNCYVNNSNTTANNNSFDSSNNDDSHNSNTKPTHEITPGEVSASVLDAFYYYNNINIPNPNCVGS